MSQVPGFGHVTFYHQPGRYPTLFHSPLVGVDKETVATSTLRFPREVRRRNELGQLKPHGVCEDNSRTHGVCDLATLMVFMKISCTGRFDTDNSRPFSPSPLNWK